MDHREPPAALLRFLEQSLRLSLGGVGPLLRGAHARVRLGLGAFRRAHPLQGLVTFPLGGGSRCVGDFQLFVRRIRQFHQLRPRAFQLILSSIGHLPQLGVLHAEGRERTLRVRGARFRVADPRSADCGVEFPFPRLFEFSGDLLQGVIELLRGDGFGLAQPPGAVELLGGGLQLCACGGEV